MKKIMLIGPVGAGKTTLKQAIYNQEITYEKTQTVEFDDDIIDTPGEFVQHRHFYSSIQNLSFEADIIGFVSSGIDTSQLYSPGFASALTKPCIGIITKKDLANEQQLEIVRDNLKQAGAQKIFEVSSVNYDGIEELRTYLNEEEV